jgi:hypothetical protein
MNTLAVADYIVFLIYFVIVASYGWWIYRKKKNIADTNDYFFAACHSDQREESVLDERAAPEQSTRTQPVIPTKGRNLFFLSGLFQNSRPVPPVIPSGSEASVLI